MTNDIPTLLSEYKNGMALLQARLNSVSDELRQYKPGPNKWSVHDIVIHLAESEVQGYLRMRTALAESGNLAINCDENKWADELYYEQQSYDDALETLILMRKNNLTLLSLVPEEKWNRYVMHSACGKLTLLDLLKTYIKHIGLHIDQINRNETQWKTGSNTSIISNK